MPRKKVELTVDDRGLLADILSYLCVLLLKYEALGRVISLTNAQISEELEEIIRNKFRVVQSDIAPDELDNDFFENFWKILNQFVTKDGLGSRRGKYLALRLMTMAANLSRLPA